MTSYDEERRRLEEKNEKYLSLVGQIGRLDREIKEMILEKRRIEYYDARFKICAKQNVEDFRGKPAWRGLKGSIDASEWRGFVDSLDAADRKRLRVYEVALVEHFAKQEFRELWSLYPEFVSGNPGPEFPETNKLELDGWFAYHNVISDIMAGLRKETDVGL